MNILQKAAEILVECGYCERIEFNTYWIGWKAFSEVKERLTADGLLPVKINPFDDTLDGRRQADAIEDYFEQNPDMWDLLNSFKRPYVYDVGESMREWRLDRIKWCLEELSK